MHRDVQKRGVLRIGNEDPEGSDKQIRRCIVDEDLACPPSRYDCARPCPFTGWERRMAKTAG
jgi:hypothetical protein